MWGISLATGQEGEMKLFTQEPSARTHVTSAGLGIFWKSLEGSPMMWHQQVLSYTAQCSQVARYLTR
jgi:hypothetical protein